MTTYTPEQFAKIPKWAQHLIRKQEADLKGAAEDIAQINGSGPTNVYIEEGIRNNRPLPNDSRIRFIFPDKTSVSVGFREGGTILDAYTYDGGISVSPASSNVIYIKANGR